MHELWCVSVLGPLCCWRCGTSSSVWGRHSENPFHGCPVCWVTCIHCLCVWECVCVHMCVFCECWAVWEFQYWFMVWPNRNSKSEISGSIVDNLSYVVWTMCVGTLRWKLACVRKYVARDHSVNKWPSPVVRVWNGHLSTFQAVFISFKGGGCT